MFLKNSCPLYLFTVFKPKQEKIQTIIPKFLDFFAEFLYNLYLNTLIFLINLPVLVISTIINFLLNSCIFILNKNLKKKKIKIKKKTTYLF